MGSKQSSLAASSSSMEKDTSINKEQTIGSSPNGERGLNELAEQKANLEASVLLTTRGSFADIVEEEEDESDDDDATSLLLTDSDEDDEEEEEDEELKERLQILQDAKKLKALAVAFLHPEQPVQVDPTACARCYFDRPSAVPQESVEEMEERERILADAAALKKLAVDYAHPEIGVTSSDPTSFGRNYFTSPSAVIEQESVEEAEERARVLADAAALKKLAVDYAHPEIGVTSSDPTSFGRNYFSRPSAIEQESVEEADERAQVLAEAAALKKLAVDYAHPEIGVTTSDSTVYGRNYFSRPSAMEQETVEEADERAQVLAEAAALKKLAVDYAHPEIGVTTSDPTSFGRNYFSRPSAMEQETFEEAEERAQVLAEAAALKKLAVDYAHPEVGVTSSDPTSFGRNYFSSPSAIEQESVEESEERAQVLAEAAALKKLAVDYAHPEIGVTSSDPTSFGRNYFSSPSVTEQETLEQSEERVQALADAAALKKLAIDYAHPELPVITTDPSVYGRNYFSTPSAPQQESVDDAEERAQVLADVAALKKLAVDYAHPEIGVATTDPTVFGRNYFTRPSAPLQETVSTEPTTSATTVTKKVESTKTVPFSKKDVTSKNKVLQNMDDLSNMTRSPSNVLLYGLDEDNAAF